MSLVGTRPPTVDEWDKYELHHRARLATKPGLTGDSSFKAIETNIKTHSAIQLPHHGKLDQADNIFSIKDNQTIYYVSDNTGNSNGGSDKLREKYPRGHVIYNTLNGEQVCTSDSFRVTSVKGSYCWGE